MLSDDIAFLVKHGLDINLLIEIERRAQQLKLPAAAVLIASGTLSQNAYYQQLASELGLEFLRKAPKDLRPITRLSDPEQLHSLARVMPVSCIRSTIDLDFGPRVYHLAPDANIFRLLKRHLARSRAIGRRIKVTSHTANLNNLIERSTTALLDNAVSSLADSLPEFSAIRVFTTSQALVLLLFVQAIAALWYLFGPAVPVLLHLLALYLYLGRAGLRLSAWKQLKPATTSATTEAAPETPKSVGAVADEDLTIYSVMVALYDEAELAAQLVESLAALDWPKELLEIKLVCEADDDKTVDACQRAIDASGHQNFAIVKVPACQPRTKPKALNFALPLCRGEFVVIYDAEDRPDPQQLRQAFLAFQKGDPKLACLQAPLVIENHGDHWLARMFATEYSALFDGLLPALGRRKLPIPLGGSSNHFKRQTLVKIGAWDPYNVTEDADLGLRLARAGCCADVIDCPTYETAPVDLSVWMRQRTRWFKGWYQTFLVHTRHVWRLKQDLGIRGYLSFVLMTLGMALSALMNPFLFYHIISMVIDLTQNIVPLWKQCLLVLDLVCIIIGYGAFVLLASRTLVLRNMPELRSSLWMVPAYWLIMSAAAWRALWQLFLCPYKWEKTPHLRRRNSTSQQ